MKEIIRYTFNDNEYVKYKDYKELHKEKEDLKTGVKYIKNQLRILGLIDEDIQMIINILLKDKTK